MGSAVYGGRQGRFHRRRIIVLAVVVLAVLIAVGSLLLATQIKSPAQEAAQTRAPALTELTAPVRRMVLTATVLAQGAVEPPRELSPSVIGGAPAGEGDVQQIVTRIFRRPGSLVGQGTVLLEVAGQPFFVLQGTVPAYRDLRPGDTGLDVAQLQDDLAVLGYSSGADTRGDFGAGTAAAVKAFYQGIGYQAPHVGAQPVAKGRKPVPEPMIPLGEYTFAPRLPARIVKLGATVGLPFKGGLTLAIGSPAIAGQLSPSTARLVRPGMPVTVTEPGNGATIHGRVTSVSRSTATKASISGGLYVHMGIRTDQPLPLSMVGHDVSLAVAAARSAGPVLAVPEAALYASADGQTYVTKVARAGRVKVSVRVGMSANGMLQVIPRQPGALAPGDQVVTGENYAGAQPGGARGGRVIVPGEPVRTP